MDGKRIATDMEAFIKKSIEDSGPRFKVKLLIVTDNSDPASRVYVKNKIKSAERCGIDAEVLSINDETEASSGYKIFNHDADGIIVQLPLKYGNERALIGCIPEGKDVDGLGLYNIGCLHSTHTNGIIPCTPKGIMTLLDAYHINIRGKHAVVVGRSHLVGRPIAELLLQRDATVTICHSHTKNLAEITRQADILIVAVGKSKLVAADMIKPGAVVVDVGINRDENGKLCGDVDFDNAKEVAGWITPVPGGVGPMTVASLMWNTMEAAF